MNKYNISSSKKLNDQLKNFLPGGVHYNFNTPDKPVTLHFVKGKGSRLWDVDGNEYLDFYGKSGALIIGHNHEKYVESLNAATQKVLAVDCCDIDEEVCSMINKCIPSAEMIRFGLSGTEIMQNALRLARAYTGRNKFLRFEGHFHGNADNIIGGKTSEDHYPMTEDCDGIYTSTAGRANNILESQSYLIQWNEPDLLEDVLHKHKDEIAAVITEPICVNGASILPNPGYLEKMRELCSKYNIVLIFDEIITGFRVGLGGAQELYNITPDLTTLGKCLGGGGLPVSALAGKKDIMKLYENRKIIHAGTFNGYPLGLAAIKATLEILSDTKANNYVKMLSFSNKVHQVMLEEAQKVGLQLIIQGHPSCASYHCREKPINKYNEINYKLQAKNMIIKSSLATYGILISPMSRIYTNISINNDDIEFLREHAYYAFEDAKRIIDRIFEA